MLRVLRFIDAKPAQQKINHVPWCTLPFIAAILSEARVGVNPVITSSKGILNNSVV